MHLNLEYRPIDAITPYKGNARTHSKRQIRQIANSIEQFGFTNPILIDKSGGIIAGHGRLAAGRLLGWKEVPVISLDHLDDKQRRAYVLADNKLALNAGWDPEILAIELQGLSDLGFDITLTGFSRAEFDTILDVSRASDPAPRPSRDDAVPEQKEQAISQRGDVWCLGRHVLLCGDARNSADYDLLLGGEKANLLFTDPPYNVAIEGNVSGLGRIRHGDFAMAAGEMSEAEFTSFLETTLGASARSCRDGAIAYVCMDWRHMGELLAAGRKVFSELKNVCLWNKSNAGMGTFYRSKHEMVFVYKVGTAPHTNNFGLGDTGRPRTNVWDYPGVSSLGGERDEALAMHPTVKPTALVADAIKDCSKRGEIVLDAFGGSGTTLIAAQITGRKARLIEFDPIYCDTIVRRFERHSGKTAKHRESGLSFDDVAESREKGAVS